jgi:hypothetical protein
MTVPKAVAGTITTTATAAMNTVTGMVRGLDHALTKGLSDNLMDIASGTTDRIPLVGKFAGNVAKIV